MIDIDLDALADELADFAQPEKVGSRSPREERVITGFEEIQRFVEKTGRAPQHGELRDIFERLYAVRLDRLRELDDCRALLAPLDQQMLLSGFAEPPAATYSLSDDELLAELNDAEETSDITTLRHVRTSAEKRAAEEIANREPCGDFETFKPLFEQVQRELHEGIRTTRAFVKNAGFQKADIKRGEFFILGGQTAYVAEIGEPFKAPNGETDARLRVIYSSGTESDLLLRSLQRALYKDETGRRITEQSAGPLFGNTWEETDIESGTIYVLRSKSEHPFVAEHRSLIHKIGVTGGKVETRLANAALDATYLLADVEIIATYKLANINRGKLENLFHRLFAPAQIDLVINDRFGNPVRPREWFLVPIAAIDEAVKRVQDGSITAYVYDTASARLVSKA